MSVTLVSQPTETIAADNCPVYSLQLTDAGSATVINSLGYEFYVDGEKLAGLTELGFTGAAEQFNFARILRAQVKATLAGYNTTSVTLDSAAVKPFYLKYGTLTWYTETCQKITALGNQSATRYAVSARFPWYLDDGEIDAGAPVVLTERPARIPIYTGQRDWIHIWRKSGGVSVQFKGYDGSGNLLVRQTASASFNKQVRIFPIGPGNGFFSGNFSGSIAYYDIDVHDGIISEPDIGVTGFGFETQDVNLDVGAQSVVWTCRFIVQSCTDGTAPNDEIYFEEPFGGYSGLRFLSVQASASPTSKRYRKGVPCGLSSPAAGLDYGTTRYDLQSFGAWLMRTEIPYVEGIERWLNAFFSARNHFLKFKLPSGSFTYAKVILSDGSYNVLNGKEAITLEAVFETHLSAI